MAEFKIGDKVRDLTMFAAGIGRQHLGQVVAIWPRTETGPVQIVGVLLRITHTIDEVLLAVEEPNMDVQEWTLSPGGQVTVR
jgi:hypothetical protein